jgi:hypothetical protein
MAMKLRRAKDSPTTSRQDLPEVNEAVRLRVEVDKQDGGLFVELPSRITDMEWDRDGGRPVVVLRAPDVSFLPAAPNPAVEHNLIWTNQRGQMELPIRLGKPQVRDYGPVWVVQVTGPARRVQRRQYCRVALQLPVRIQVPEHGDVPTTDYTGKTLDLSEGGALCLLATGPPDVGTSLVMYVTIGEQQLRLPAVVVRHSLMENTDLPAVALRFDDPEEHGDVIRQEVFAVQLRNRSLSRQAEE